MSQPELSIIIVNYNVRYFLEQCLQSVLDASVNISSEIIVVDNNSPDSSCDMIKTKFPQVKLIANKENTGFSKANNQGVAVAKGDYVLILNPDTVVAEDTFEKILAFAKKKNNLGILGVKLIDGTGKYLPESKRGIPTPRVALRKLLGYSSNQKGKYYATHLRDNESGIVEILVGAFMLIKRQVYNEVGGFDEDYFMYGEDIDISYKIHHKGYQNYYYSDTKIIHYKGESTRKDIKYLRYFYGAMKIFYQKHFSLNVVYDFLMGFGIRFWYSIQFLKLKRPASTIKVNTIIYIGQDESAFLKITNLFTNVSRQNDLNVNELISKAPEMLVFDNNYLSNKVIIDAMSVIHQKHKHIHFRWIPKNCHFIIGSDHSINQGKVITL